MQSQDKIHNIILVTLILLIGLICGYSIGYYKAKINHFPQLKWVSDINEKIPTIKLLEVKNGVLVGENNEKRMRLAYNPEKIIELEPNELFTIPLNQVSLSHFYQAKNIPKGSLFIASRTGKYYYSIFDKKAFGITSKNRIYFQSEEEAVLLGYLKKENKR